MGMHGPEPGWDVWRSTILSNLAVTGVEHGISGLRSACAATGRAGV